MHNFKHVKLLGIILLIIGASTLLGVIINSWFFITLGNTILSLVFIAAGIRMVSSTHGPNCQCKMCKYRRQMEAGLEHMTKNHEPEEVVVEEEIV